MEPVDLRDFERDPAEVLRRLEGEPEILITDAGRPAARLVRAEPPIWRRWTEVKHLFAGPSDPDLRIEHDAISDPVGDPWDRTTDR